MNDIIHEVIEYHLDSNSPVGYRKDHYLLVKPTKPVEFIRLDFVAVRDGSKFEEIVGKYGKEYP